MLTCGSLPHLLEFLTTPMACFQSCFDHYTPLPSNHLHQPCWLAPHCWQLITVHTVPYINSVRTASCLVGFLTLEDGTNKLSKTLVRNYRYLLRNNPEECSSLLNNVCFFFCVKEIRYKTVMCPRRPYRIMWIGIEMSCSSVNMGHLKAQSWGSFCHCSKNTAQKKFHFVCATHSSFSGIHHRVLIQFHPTDCVYDGCKSRSHGCRLPQPFSSLL
jgi:hypothetical protein